jgi:hypothetical protein
MPPRPQPRAPPQKPDLTVDSPSALITIPTSRMLSFMRLAATPSPMQPTSASMYEYTAA